MKKKLYLVKREVYAANIQKAAESRGVIYEITLAEDKLQPEDKSETKGFIKR